MIKLLLNDGDMNSILRYNYKRVSGLKGFTRTPSSNQIPRRYFEYSKSQLDREIREAQALRRLLGSRSMGFNDVYRGFNLMAGGRGGGMAALVRPPRYGDLLASLPETFRLDP